jgi:hypothetical protein
MERPENKRNIIRGKGDYIEYVLSKPPLRRNRWNKENLQDLETEEIPVKP